MSPISLGSLIGPIILGRYFDKYGRRLMMVSTYLSSGVLVIIQGVMFGKEWMDVSQQSAVWLLVFMVASPAASSAHLTVSELFPVQFRMHAMAFFFSVSLFIGGVLTPYLFSLLMVSKFYVGMGYALAGSFMIAASVVVYFLGVDAENKTLE